MEDLKKVETEVKDIAAVRNVLFSLNIKLN